MLSSALLITSSVYALAADGIAGSSKINRGTYISFFIFVVLYVVKGFGVGRPQKVLTCLFTYTII